MKIALCIVLYNCRIDQSSTIKSIKDYLNNVNAYNEFNILVYDNSKVEQMTTDSRFQYIPNRTNLFLSENYNKALEFSIQNQCDWLVLLDQDTCLSNDYLDIIFNKELDSCIAAYVPHIVTSNGNKVAPQFMRVKCKIDNKNRKGIFSVNSGTILNVAFFKDKLKNFSLEYPLDFLDNWYFQNINYEGGIIKVLPVTITHDLSIAKGHSVVSIERYKSILSSERKFIYTERSHCERVGYKIRLIYRYFKWKVKGYKEHSKVVKDFLFYGKSVSSLRNNKI